MPILYRKPKPPIHCFHHDLLPPERQRACWVQPIPKTPRARLVFLRSADQRAIEDMLCAVKAAARARADAEAARDPAPVKRAAKRPASRPGKPTPQQRPSQSSGGKGVTR